MNVKRDQDILKYNCEIDKNKVVDYYRKLK
jgi:hypothetical protein